jgi:type I restriction enzyme S subunit
MEHITIEECCDILDSRRIPITASERRNGRYPYYGANGIQDYVADYIFDDELVLLAEDGGNFGSKTRPIAYRVSGKCWVNNHAHVLKPMANVDVDYLCYSLMFYDTEELVNGATRQKLTQAAMRKMLIPQRPITEQKKIVSELSKIQSIISVRQQQLQKLDELVKARFVELFGDMFLNFEEWNEAPLESLADIVSGITKGRKVSEKHLIKVPYMAVSNVKEGYIDWTTVKTIEATEQEINQYRLLPDDVLMTEGGDPDKLGRGAIIKAPMENCIHQNHIFRVRLDETHILPVYFAEYLQHQRAKRYFLGCAKQTTGIASINMRQLKALPVLIPPLGLQNQFAAFVTQTDKSKVAVQKALDEAQLLFDSLMQKYFG